MKTDVTILGCGPSGGVPDLSPNPWGRCDPADPRNSRQRSSAFVVHNGRRYLIDSGPDCRNQLLQHDIRGLDAVLYTHSHADHIGGVEDLRHLQWDHPGRIIDAYGVAEHLEEIENRFSFCIHHDDDNPHEMYTPYLRLNPIAIHGGRLPLDPTITTLKIDHHIIECAAWKFGDNVAYCLDCVEIPDETFDALEGIDTWIVDCAVEKPHPTHAHLDKVLEWHQRVKPRRTILSTMSKLFDYKTLAAELPEGVYPAYDGMTFSVEAASVSMAAE